MMRTLPAAALVALLVAPRILRLVHPQVWIEDESYLTGALLLSHGALPYRDFPLPHFPVLEALLAAGFQVAGASIRSAEVFTQSAALAGSLLVFTIGRRLDGVVTGIVAAVIFATSGLLFRYHVFEREVFLVVPVLAAAFVAGNSGHDDKSMGRSIGAGFLLFVALAIKLTAIAAVAAVALDLWRRHRARSAAIVLIVAFGSLAVLAAILTVLFGADFLVQVFVFRAVHAAFPSLSVKLDEMRLTMDISLALGAAGVGLIAWTRDARRWEMPLLQLGCGFVVLVFLNPTYWAHTGIELLPWLALAAGHLVARAVSAVAGDRRPRMPVIVSVGAAAGMLVFVAPIRNLNWQAGDGSAAGFGYRDRAELERVGRYVRDHSAPNELVVTPPMIAFVANRTELIPYPEIAGSVQQMTDIVRRRGYVAALTDPDVRHESFWASVEASRDREALRIAAALQARRIAVVIDDSADDLMPFPMVDISPDVLAKNGYSLESASAHYDVWLRR
jgi:hypothetical protein